MIELKGKSYNGIYHPITSKSDAHRAIILACLSKKKSKIYNVYFSNDVKATISCLISMGANINIDEENNSLEIIKGISYNKEVTLDVGESGSTFRFLIPLCSIFNEKTIFITHGRLGNRPLDVYYKIFEPLGIKLSKEDNIFTLEGKLVPQTYQVDGNISSQFITGLLLSLPCLEKDSTIKINNQISSLDYILMSINTLKQFGVNIDFDIKNQIIKIPGRSVFEKESYFVESDYSQAAFFICLGVINEGIIVKNLNKNSYQPDRQIISILKSLNGDLKFVNDDLIVNKSLLKGGVISLDSCPDLGPVLMGISCYSQEKITFKDIKRLRIKESDRVQAMAYNLNLLGIKYDLKEDEMTIYPSKIVYNGEILKSFNDHRIFMALKIMCYDKDIIIDEEKCLAKSYPTFLKDLEKLERE